MSFGTRWTSRRGTPPWVGRSAGGTPGSLTPIPTWIRFDFTYLDFLAATLEQSILLYSLPAGGMVGGAKLKHTTLFTGPGNLTAEASVGPGGLGYAENDTNNGRFSLSAILRGTAFNTKTLEITDTVLAGAETVTWAANTLTIQVEAGVSTVAQVLAAVPVGTPWAVLTQTVAGTVDALGVTAMSALPAYVAGVDGNLEEIVPLFDVAQAVADTTLAVSNIQVGYNQNAATDLQLRLLVTGANLDTLTQGELSVWLLLSVAV